MLPPSLCPKLSTNEWTWIRVLSMKKTEKRLRPLCRARIPRKVCKLSWRILSGTSWVRKIVKTTKITIESAVEIINLLGICYFTTGSLIGFFFFFGKLYVFVIIITTYYMLCTKVVSFRINFLIKRIDMPLEECEHYQSSSYFFYPPSASSTAYFFSRYPKHAA